MIDIPNASDSELHVGNTAPIIFGASGSVPVGQLTYPLDPVSIQIITQIVNGLLPKNSDVETVSINGLSTGSQNNLSSGTSTQVQFTGNSFANGITWDALNYQFIVKTAGQYAITGYVDFGSSLATSVYAVGIFINGSQVVYEKRYVTGNNAINCMSNIIYNLSVGDTVQLWMGQNSGFTNSLAAAYLCLAKV